MLERIARLHELAESTLIRGNISWILIEDLPDFLQIIHEMKSEIKLQIEFYDRITVKIRRSFSKK